MYIKRRIDESLVTFKNLHFSYSVKQKSHLRYRVTIGIGGNIGDVKRRFQKLFFFFKKQKKVELLQTALILKNPPFGYENQDDFFNSIMVLQTSLQPLAFLTYIQNVEKKFARKRSFANAPRSLDLDIIFFDKRVVNSKRLTIPHAHWSKRQSVVIPLKDVEI